MNTQTDKTDTQTKAHMHAHTLTHTDPKQNDLFTSLVYIETQMIMQIMIIMENTEDNQLTMLHTQNE